MYLALELHTLVEKYIHMNSCLMFILTIHQCYDIRFPELSLMLAKMGADILTFPSAFTYVTGAAHWETLVRARAIESQCYVIAAAQTGAHNNKRTSWGHAMVCNN
jgi:predicted amidohydrolase